LREISRSASAELGKSIRVQRVAERVPLALSLFHSTILAVILAVS